MTVIIGLLAGSLGTLGGQSIYWYQQTITTRIDAKFKEMDDKWTEFHKDQDDLKIEAGKVHDWMVREQAKEEAKTTDSNQKQEEIKVSSAK